MAEIRLKTVEYAQFKFEKLAEMFSNLSNVVRIGGQKTSNGSIFDQMGLNSTTISVGNTTARIRPFLGI
jgi:hypothetical protein